MLLTTIKTNVIPAIFLLVAIAMLIGLIVYVLNQPIEHLHLFTKN